MKLKTVYSTIALIFVVVGIALWKLNDTYRTEKISVKQNQLQTQLTALRSSLVSQISQLRNTLSAYTGQIDESKINWVQLKPFYALAVVQEDGSNRLTISKLFLQSGSVADRWNATTLQQYLQNKVSGNQLLRAQTFKDGSGLVHLTLTVFDREKRNNQPRTGVMVVGDVSYFQRFFDLQRTSSITQVLLNADKQVAAHSEYEYVGNQSDENKISEANFFVDRQEIRGTNLNLLSYSSKKASANLDIPLSILGIIIGLAFLMSGVLLFAAKPEKEPAPASVGPAPKKAKTNVYSEVSEEGDFGIGLGDSAPTPKPLARQPEVKKTPAAQQAKPNFIPLSFDEAPQVVPIQVQACAQQALFNVDRQLKASGISVAKEFVSGETVTLDYPKFIKIFENVLLTVAQSLTGNKKRIQLRSYDSDSLTTLEIQASVPSLNLHEAIFPVLAEANCEFSQVASSAGEAIFRFTFTRPEDLEHVQAPIKFEMPKASDEKRFELTEDDASDFAMPEKLTPFAKPAAAVQNDLDIDALLSLDDEPAIAVTPDAPKVAIEKEMQPSKFKLDEKMSIVEDPVIDIETAEDTKADKTKVKIRRPEKG